MKQVTKSKIENNDSVRNLETFSHILNKYSNAVFACALQIIRDSHYAQDITQEVFIRAWRNLGQLRDQERLGIWLYSITKRIAIDWIRKNNRHHSISLLEMRDISSNETTEELILLKEQKRLVWDAIGQLKESDRTVILMYYMSGFNTREIAQFLDVPTNTIESRLKRTRVKLKEGLIEAVGDVLKNERLCQQQYKGKVTINLSFALGSMYIEPLTEHVVRNFEKANPHIKVNVTAYDLCEIPLVNYEEELIKQMVTGSQPDVAFFDPFHIPSWVEKGLLNSISTRINEAGIKSERFYDNAWHSCEYQGEMYALPWNMSNSALFYNKAMMREVGLDPNQPPKTIEDLDRMAGRMFKEDATGHFTHVGFVPWFSAGNFFLNSVIWHGEWEREGKLTPADPRNVQTLCWMKSYADRYGNKKLITFLDSILQLANPYNHFGFVFLGCWDMWNIYPRYLHKDEDWGIAPLPTIDGSTAVTSEGGFSFVIPKGAAHEDEAWEFIKYAAYGEGLDYWIKVDPERNLAPMAEVNLRHPFANDPKFKVFIDSIPSGKRRPASPAAPSIWSELSKIAEMVMTGHGDPQELLVQLQTKLDSGVKIEEKK
jgi:multiple sugar transport system substrate-binding protein